MGKALIVFIAFVMVVGIIAAAISILAAVRALVRFLARHCDRSD